MTRKVAFIFPGQGSQRVGMGKASLTNDTVKHYINKADEILGFELSKIMFEGPEEELTLTENAQPALFTISYALFQVLVESVDHKHMEFFLGGHSLGEYTAVACSGGMTFEDCLKLVRMRGKFMQEAVPKGQGYMAAVMLPKDDVKRELKGFSNIWIANTNSQEQVVVSGTKEELDGFLQHMRRRNVRVIPLKVSAPFHCPLMLPAMEKLKSEFDKVKIGELKYRVLSAHTLQYYSAEDIKRTLLEGMISEVNFYGLVEKLYEEGVRDFVEVGSGKVLSSLIRRILGGSASLNIFTINEVSDIGTFI